MKESTIVKESTGLIFKKPKKKFGVLKKLFLAIAVFFAIIIGFTYLTTAGAKKVADEFIGYVQSVDSNSAYELLSTDGKASGSREDFASFITRIGPILDGEVESNGVGASAGSNQDTISTIKYKIPGSDGKTYSVVVNLIKENDIWRVNDITSDEE